MVIISQRMKCRRLYEEADRVVWCVWLIEPSFNDLVQNTPRTVVYRQALPPYVNKG